MAEEPVKCGKPFTWMECEQPLGHEGDHGGMVQLPPDIGKMLAAKVNDLERATLSAYRRRRSATIFLIASVLMYTFSLIQSLT